MKSPRLLCSVTTSEHESFGSCRKNLLLNKCMQLKPHGPQLAFREGLTK